MLLANPLDGGAPHGWVRVRQKSRQSSTALGRSPATKRQENSEPYPRVAHIHVLQQRRRCTRLPERFDGRAAKKRVLVRQQWDQAVQGFLAVQFRNGLPA